MERLVDLTAPPVVGRTYLVPVVGGGEASFPRPVAVIGVVHNDAELGVVDVDHIHIDTRFTPAADLLDNGLLRFRPEQVEGQGGCPHGGALAVGLADRDRLRLREEPRVCLADEFPQQDCFKAGYVGYLAYEVQLMLARGVTGLDRACKICPHKGTPLDNVKPKGGKLLCPAHGMEFDPETGAILPFWSRRPLHARRLTDQEKTA